MISGNLFSVRHHFLHVSVNKTFRNDQTVPIHPYQAASIKNHVPNQKLFSFSTYVAKKCNNKFIHDHSEFQNVSSNFHHIQQNCHSIRSKPFSLYKHRNYLLDIAFGGTSIMNSGVLSEARSSNEYSMLLGRTNSCSFVRIIPWKLCHYITLSIRTE